MLSPYVLIALASPIVLNTVSLLFKCVFTNNSYAFLNTVIRECQEYSPHLLSNRSSGQFGCLSLLIPKHYFTPRFLPVLIKRRELHAKIMERRRIYQAILFLYLAEVIASDESYALLEELFEKKRYNKYVRPVLNESTPVLINMELYLSQINDVVR